MFDDVELMISCVFASIFGAAFEPVTLLVALFNSLGTLNSEIECIEDAVLFDFDKDSSLDAGTRVVVWFLSLNKHVYVFVVVSCVAHLFRTTLECSKMFIKF